MKNSTENTFFHEYDRYLFYHAWELDWVSTVNLLMSAVNVNILGNFT